MLPAARVYSVCGECRETCGKRVVGLSGLVVTTGEGENVLPLQQYLGKLEVAERAADGKQLAR